MNNITTQKIALGVLMALVLAFGLQSTADAYVMLRGADDSSTHERTNHQRQQKNLPLPAPIKFSVRDVDDPDYITISIEHTSGSNGRIDEIRVGSTKVYAYDGQTPQISVVLHAGGADEASPDISDSNDVSGSNAQNLKNGGTISVYCILPNEVGDLTVTIADGGNTDDTDNDDDDYVSSIAYTAYSVEDRVTIESDTDITISLGNSAINNNPTGDIFMNATVIDGPTDNYVLVDFEVSGGRFVWPSNTTDPENLADSITLHTGSGGRLGRDLRIRPSSRATVQVEASIRFSNPTKEDTRTFYYQDAVLDLISGDDQEGYPETRLPSSLVVRVEDDNGRAIPGEYVVFDESGRPTNDLARRVVTGLQYLAIPGTKVWDFENDKVVDVTSDHDYADDPQDRLIVVSDSRSGEAKVYAVLPTAALDDSNNPTKGYYEPQAQIMNANPPDDDAATATLPVFAHNDAIQRFTIVSDPARTGATRRIRILSGDRQSVEAREDTKPMVVMVESGGQPVAGVSVTFDANIGTLEFDDDDHFGALPTTGSPVSSGKTVIVNTDANGKASLDFSNVGADTGVRDVDASIGFTSNTDSETTKVTFYISVDGATIRRPSPPSVDRDDDDDDDDTVDDRDDDPADDDDTAPPPATSQASNILIISGNSQVAKVNSPLQPFVVQVNDQTGAAMSGVSVTFTNNSSGSLSSTSDTTNSSGRADTTLTLGSTAGIYSVQASATGVTFSQTFTAIAQAPVLSQLQLRGESSRSVYVGTRMRDPLTVRVLDTDSDPVQGVQVTFTVVSGGTGTATPLTQSDTSDTDGSATAYFTPTGAGTIMIDASAAGLTPTRFTLTATLPPSKIVKISGDNQAGGPGKKLAEPFVVEIQDANSDPISGITVTFDVTSGGGSVSPESATTDADGRAQSVLKLGTDRGRNSADATVEGVAAFATFKAVAGAEVRLDAAKRPPLYWVDTEAGTLHRLTGDRVENLASSVEGVTSIAVDETNGLLYFGVQTGRSGGKIQRSGLNGRNVETLKDGLTSVPMGIALDGAGDRLYWTSSSGKIKSVATTGSTRTTNVLQNLASPTALTLSNGYIYWAEPLGRIRRMNLTASRKVTVNIATGLGEPLSIAIANGKIYWVEISGSGGGKLQRANLDGTRIEQLKVFTGSVPAGISIDSSSNKIYWTKADKIQRTNLTGRLATHVVIELISPGAIAIGGALPDAAPVTDRTPPPTRKPATQTPKTYSKYDVNKDGSINNADTKAVAGAVGQSGAAITNPRADVDGSGTVDVTDLILVIANLDDDVAAPAIDIDLTVLDLDFDRVQEQIEMLLASGDRSHAAQRALMYLQHLLASARPDATVLLANYPNPFNPETWIPYHLATSTDVGINIYNAQGILVRALTLGHQSAGYYTSRSRAAYWDGRNALGERVASGIYFYQLETDEVSPMRKMVILK